MTKEKLYDSVDAYTQSILDEFFKYNAVIPKQNKRKCNLPKYIHHARNNTYRVVISRMHYGYFDDIQSAICMRDDVLKHYKNEGGC